MRPGRHAQIFASLVPAIDFGDLVESKECQNENNFPGADFFRGKIWGHLGLHGLLVQGKLCLSHAGGVHRPRHLAGGAGANLST